MGIERESNLVFYAQSTSTGDQRERERELCMYAGRLKKRKKKKTAYRFGLAVRR